MDYSKLRSAPCPLSRALGYAGDAWSMLILRDANMGLTRFDEFRVSLGIAPNILARRLNELNEAGLLTKRRYSERPPRDEYLLSAVGRDLLPVLLAMAAWGARHYGDGDTLAFVDFESGEPLRVSIVDAESGGPVADGMMRLAQPGGEAPRRNWLLD